MAKDLTEELPNPGCVRRQTVRLPQSPDAALVSASLKGDDIAFDQLFARHYPSIFGVCKSQIGDSSHAEDAAQETFMRAYKYLGTLKEPASFRAWACRIAVNQCITLKTRLSSAERTFTEVGVDYTGEAEVADDEEWNEWVRKLGTEWRHLRSALAELKLEHQEILMMHYWEGMLLREISEELGCSLSFVKVVLHRARKHLAGKLAAQSKLLSFDQRSSERTAVASSG